MLVVLSGEGPSDIGGSTNSSAACGTADFRAGPLATMILKKIEQHIGYSPTDCHLVHWVSRSELSRVSGELPRVPRFSAPGAKSPREVLAIARSALAMGVVAKRIEDETEAQGVAILFHDSDGTHADGVNRWLHIHDAMLRGFDQAGFARGVPMIPKPKQEAWFLCALKPNSYSGCAALEHESGNDSSPNNLKSQLKAAVGRDITTEDLVEMVESDLIDWDRIEMPSLRAFFSRLSDVIVPWKTGVSV